MKKLIACLLGAAVAVSAAAITPKEEIKENPQKVNRTPKVRHKTFGVHYV